MQKKLIALAIAGLASGAAFSQTNVTVYGVADASFENTRATGATANALGAANTAVELNSRNRIVSNSSYIGFKGVEDLGNGLKGVFQIETQVALDNKGDSTAGTAANTFANRDSFVGLSGNFGTVMLGYLSTPHRLQFAGFDPLPGATGIGNMNSLLGHLNIGASRAAYGTTANTFAGANNANAIFRSQALAYATPTFSGFSGMIAYLPNETKTAAANGTVFAAGATADLNPSAWNASVAYNNGPIKVGYSYLDAKDMQSAGAATGGLLANQGSHFRSHLLQGAYTFGGATTIGLAYNQNKLTTDGQAAGAVGMTGAKNTVWGVTAKHLMGAHEIAAIYLRATDGSVNTTGVGATANADERGAHQWTLRYAYNLSKRTQAYAVYSQINNKANGNYDFGAGLSANNTQAGSVNSGANISAGADPKSFGLGLRHTF